MENKYKPQEIKAAKSFMLSIMEEDIVYQLYDFADIFSTSASSSNLNRSVFCSSIFASALDMLVEEGKVRQWRNIPSPDWNYQIVESEQQPTKENKTPQLSSPELRQFAIIKAKRILEMKDHHYICLKAGICPHCGAELLHTKAQFEDDLCIESDYADMQKNQRLQNTKS